MTGASTPWPELTEPLEVVQAEIRWRYSSSCAAGYGEAQLVVWRAEAGHIAVVTELGIGASITNSVEHIWRALVETYGQPLVLLEHWLATTDVSEHLDQVHVDNGQAEWRRIWPTGPEHPDRDRFTTWVQALREVSTPELPHGVATQPDVVWVDPPSKPEFDWSEPFRRP
jgi:hypothetical protein